MPANLSLDGPFVAIDFETADYLPDSACAVGLVRVEGMQIVQRATVLIRPPRQSFIFTYVHGITWAMVAEESCFADAWPLLAPILDGAAFLAAHNAHFDRRVLNACCAAADLTVPEQSFVCSLQLARRTWRERYNGLAAVCRRLGIGLKHHDAGSDAEACARIVIAARAVANEDSAGLPAQRSM